MSTQLCPCCNDLVDCLLSLPCHPQHQSCMNCLETRREPIGRSIKCQDCREVFGWLDLDLLAASDGNMPVKQTCSPCNEEGSQVQAEFFCVTCQKSVCGGCRKFHDRFFKAEQHQVVTFNEYRKTSDQLLKKFCDVPEHSSYEFNSFCINCNSVICSKCLSIQCTEQAVEHVVTEIDMENKKRLMELDAEVAALQERIEKNEASIKQTQDEMETLRVKTEELKTGINETFEEKLKNVTEALEAKRSDLMQIVDEHLQTTADKVTRYLDAAKGLVMELQTAKEGISAVVQFTHPAHVLRIHEEVNSRIREIRDHTDDEKPKLPYYVTYKTEHHLGLDISFPPLSINPTTHRLVDLNQGNCYSVEFDKRDKLLHAGQSYTCEEVLNGIEEVMGIIVSIRQANDHIALLNVEGSNKATLQFYRPINCLNKQPSYRKFCSFQSAAKHEKIIISRLAITDSNLYQISPSEAEVLIYSRQNRKVTKRVGGFASPSGVCADEGEKKIYITDLGCQSLFVCNIGGDNLRQLCGGLPAPIVPRLHRGLIYVLNKDDQPKPKILTVITKEGNVLQNLVIPDSASLSVYDFAIDSQGVVAIACCDKGVKIYQLQYPVPSPLRPIPTRRGKFNS